MKITFLGAGTWGFCLASLLASKGHIITSWTRNQHLADILSHGQDHPHLPGYSAQEGMHFTTNLHQAIDGTDLIIESVTAAGIRPVFIEVATLPLPDCPIVVTSKGIEQHTGLILPDVLHEILGDSSRDKIALLSGPGYAKEVIAGLPTSIVASAYSPKTITFICDLFATPTFRVYPNSDLIGVSYGGALKNIVAIACGISEGLGLGNSAKAALMTRGLHEIRKIATAVGCRQDTLYGLSGMGDLCLTCCSMTSRNTRFGFLLAQGLSPKEAEKKIDMVVEGVYTCISALELGKKHNIEMPITEQIYKIIYEGTKPSEAARALMMRAIKEEHL